MWLYTPGRAAAMCHHCKGSRNPPAHLADEFSVRSNQYQLDFPEYPPRGFYPLEKVTPIRLDAHGEREMVAAEWGLLPFWWKPSDKMPKRSAFKRKCFNARSEGRRQQAVVPRGVQTAALLIAGQPRDKGIADTKNLKKGQLMPPTERRR